MAGTHNDDSSIRQKASHNQSSVNPGLTSLWRRALEQTIELAALHLGKLRKYAPRNVLDRYDAWRLRHMVFKGERRLVPEAALEDSYNQALQLLKSKGVELGDYLEFGVYCGASLACMHRTLQRTRINHVRLFGFDSFEGFPDIAKYDDGGAWQPGDFRFDYKSTRKFLTLSGVDWGRVFLTKGFFSDTLKSDLIRRHRINKASLIMVDCDLYTSSKEALNFCAPLIKDHAVIFFDDWNSHNGKLARNNMGQKRAFDEFLKENSHFIAEELVSYTSHVNNWPNNAKVFLVSHADSQTHTPGTTCSNCISAAWTLDFGWSELIGYSGLC